MRSWSIDANHVIVLSIIAAAYDSRSRPASFAVILSSLLIYFFFFCLHPPLSLIRYVYLYHYFQIFEFPDFNYINENKIISMAKLDVTNLLPKTSQFDLLLTIKFITVSTLSNCHPCCPPPLVFYITADPTALRFFRIVSYPLFIEFNEKKKKKKNT